LAEKSLDRKPAPIEGSCKPDVYYQNVMHNSAYKGISIERNF